MKTLYGIKPNFLIIGITLFIASCDAGRHENIGKTIITKWKGDKRSAISITYDDGTINQFTVARPIMNKLGIPGTFYIITGKVEGSAHGKFIGRPENEIINETASVKTNENNFFERASLIAYTGIEGAVDYHSNAGSLYESGKITDAYKLIDEAYEKVRGSNLIRGHGEDYNNNSVDTTSWDDYRTYAAEGHEIASHTITHPRLAVLDEANLLYELEQSKADILKFLGEKYTFSAECPYGTEDDRVMEYAYDIYPALRNRMPEPYLDELNRSSNEQPGESDKEYVQWQRGPLTNISMEEMKSWVDTCLVYDNIWLVLIFHGIDGIGWEPRTGEELKEYFRYMKDREDDLWIATFADVTKYIRERKNTVINSAMRDNEIIVKIISELNASVYDVPLTLKTYIPRTWEAVHLEKTSDEDSLKLEIQQDDQGFYVIYSVIPGESEVKLKQQT